MTDERFEPSRGRLDDAIDRTIHALVRRDAPVAIRQRVLARLADRLPAGSPRLSRWLQPKQLAWSAGALALVVAIALVAPHWRQRSEVSAPQGTAGMPWESPTLRSAQTGTMRASPTSAAQAAQVDSPATRLSGPPARRTSAAVSLPAVRLPFVDPLPAPDSIEIAALVTERVIAESVIIEPMRFDALRVEPIQMRR